MTKNGATNSGSKERDFVKLSDMKNQKEELTEEMQDTIESSGEDSRMAIQMMHNEYSHEELNSQQL